VRQGCLEECSAVGLGGDDESEDEMTSKEIRKHYGADVLEKTILAAAEKDHSTAGAQIGLMSILICAVGELAAQVAELRELKEQNL
jgi:hypothetical protein